MSYPGFLTYKGLDTLVTCNYPMLAVENNVLDGIVDKNNLEYLYYNERDLCTVYVPKYKWHYHVLLIADMDIDVIMHYSDAEGEFYYQGERTSVIKYGSQVDLILPLSKNGELPFKYKFKQKELMHVEAGQDILIDIID
jgi:phosphatidylserine decarboxylase